MSRKNTLIIAAASAVIFVALATGWRAHAQTATNLPAGFERPLIVDLKMARDIEALTQRVEILEAEVKNLKVRSPAK